MKQLLVIVLSFLMVSCKISQDINVKTAVLEYKTQADLGEGAIWNYKTDELYWVDIEGKKLNIYNSNTKTNKVLNTPSRIGTVVPFSEKEVLVALEDGVYKMSVDSGKTELFVAMEQELVGSRLNDGKCDPMGRFWVGSMHLKQEEGKANLYTITAENQIQKKLDRVTISNGIVWTADKKTMYYIDTPTSSIKAFDYNNSSGEITNGRVVVHIPESLGYPDGMTIDSKGMLWVGMWNGNAVINFNPYTGKVISKIEVPAHNVTSCAFGGKDLEVLYITTATVDMTKEETKKYPLSGSIFKAIPGVTGVECNFFRE